MCVCVCARVCVLLYVYARVYVYIYIYTYIANIAKKLEKSTWSQIIRLFDHPNVHLRHVHVNQWGWLLTCTSRVLTCKLYMRKLSTVLCPLAPPLSRSPVEHGWRESTRHTLP